jgi:hypothetical protein
VQENLAHYYRVPAIREYEEEWIEVKEGERLDAKAETEKDEETGKSYCKVITDKVTAIRPDFPSGISYTCKLVDGDTFIVKTERPVKAKGFREAERLIHSEQRAERKSLERQEPKEAAAIEQLRRSFSVEVRR